MAIQTRKFYVSFEAFERNKPLEESAVNIIVETDGDTPGILVGKDYISLNHVVKAYLDLKAPTINTYSKYFEIFHSTDGHISVKALTDHRTKVGYEIIDFY